jgi:hypothetical protein
MEYKMTFVQVAMFITVVEVAQVMPVVMQAVAVLVMVVKAVVATGVVVSQDLVRVLPILEEAEAERTMEVRVMGDRELLLLDTLPLRFPQPLMVT